VKALRKPGRLALIVCLTFALVGAVSGVTFSAFTSKADNTGNLISAAPDWKGPTVSGGIATATGVLGQIKQGDSVYLYLNVNDLGNPASGVASVSGSTTVPGYGTITLPLTAGSYTLRGTTYNYRSAAQPLPPVFAEQTLPITVTATDNAGNTTNQSLSVDVDNTAPTATDIQTANKTGGQAGKAEQGDTITYTFSEAMDPYSIINLWDGTARNVTLRLNDGGAGNDTVTVLNGATQIPLGSVNLGNTGYVTATRDFTNSTMTRSGSTIVITLGTPSGATGTVAGTANMIWTPSATATDESGNAMSTTPRTETGTVDRDF
jgi:hypothetical protein